MLRRIGLGSTIMNQLTDTCIKAVKTESKYQAAAIQWVTLTFELDIRWAKVKMLSEFSLSEVKS